MQSGITEIILPRDQTLEQKLAFARDCGYKGYEVALRQEVIEADAATRLQEIRKMQKLAQQYGLTYTSAVQRLNHPMDLFTNNEEIRSKAIAALPRLLEAAGELGVDTILLHPGQLPEDVPYDIGYQRVREGVMNAAEAAEKNKVNIGIENVWNKFFMSPLELRDFIDEIGSDYVGSYFDTGNVVLFGYPEHWIRILGKRIKKVHVKDFKRKGYEWTQLMDGDVNWPATMQALRDYVGYDQALIQEVGGAPDVARECVNRIEKIISL